MSIPWIATNPVHNNGNLAFQIPFPQHEFEDLCRHLVHETNNCDKKIQMLFQSKGFFNAEQAGHVLSMITRPVDKLKAMQVIEPRLLPMTSQHARNILATFTIANDRLEALKLVKRALNDSETQTGIDYILSTFSFEDDKNVAASILDTVRSRAGFKIAAGGHQGYAPLGGLYTNAKPNNTHIYGAAKEQVRHLPNHGTGTITVAEAFEPKLPSIYADAQSYAPNKSKTSYSYVQGYQGQTNKV